jgi:methionyl-tRNA synthetase
MLLSAGLPVAKQVFGHGFVHFRGERMSKTLGTVVDPLDAAEKFGPDPLRLYLAREIVFGQDGDFSWERFEARYNADLANNLGNLVSRIASMAAKYRNGLLTAPSPSASSRLRDKAKEVRERYIERMEAFAIQDGVNAAFELVDTVNEFLTESEPWVLAKDVKNAERLSAVLFDAAEATRIGAVLLFPVIPASATQILERFGATRSGSALRLDRDTEWGASGNLKVATGPALWPRLEAKT